MINKETIKELNRIASWGEGEIRDKMFAKVLAKQVPMGASQWREHGKKYGYWKYFEDKINKKWEKKILIIPKGSTHPRHDKCEYCFELAREEIKEMIEEMSVPIGSEGSEKRAYDQALSDVIKKL